ncbi:alpha/beta fold hydrolase [Gilvimarinus agarilyticus]|uniref:alpha/beta fold hydrolase n=1 Tax=Gilvimarinus agarilyticus TaxID=679259 RepID=UPI0005A0A3F5|nr:alpha/beta hydrolase [Gilvimarinus agarilyticus]
MHWVLLRGLGRESAHWGAFSAQCEAQLGEPFLCLDVPGSGVHYGQVSPDTIGAMREFVQAQLAKKLPPDAPIAIVGLSMGGMLALDWALAEPQRVRRLVLINSSSRLSPFWHRLRWRNWGSVAVALFDRRIPRCERRILRMVSNSAANRDALLRKWVTIQTRRPVSKSNLRRQLHAASCYQVNQAPTPATLVLTSRADQMVSWHCSEALARYLQADMAIHPSAGHDLPVDAPEWVLDQIQQWKSS